MTQTECNQWWNDYQAKFPSAGRWASALSDVQWREIFAAWVDLLRSTPLADALEVNRLMRSGAIPEVGSFDHEREKIGHVVRSEADALQRARRSPTVSHWEVERFRCLDCEDCGLVEVFRNEWLSFLAAQQEIPASFHAAATFGWRRGRPTQSVLCACEAGERLIYRGPAEKKPAGLSPSRNNTPDGLRYSLERYRRVPKAADFSPAEWELAIEWLRERRDAIRGARVYDEFEAWNSR